MTHEYDEDLTQNPFFKQFVENYFELFEKCVKEEWLICVPRAEVVPATHHFSLEDYTHHILRPLNISVELQAKNELGTDENKSFSSCSSSAYSSWTNLSDSVSSEVSSSSMPSWNFRSLADINVHYKDRTLFIELGSSNISECSKINSNNNNRNFDSTETISVLFEETFYTVSKAKYKVLCVNALMNSFTTDHVRFAKFDEGRNPGLWNLTSLGDCKDFLWTNSSAKILETFDAHIKLFLHNHRSLMDLPLPVQRDLVLDLYRRCYHHVKRFWQRAVRNLPNVSDSKHALQNFALATETYILNGVYRQLIGALTSAVSYEDSILNKIMRNAADIHPQDLNIQNFQWEDLARARQELSNFQFHSTPLGKLNTLKKIMKILERSRCQRETGKNGGDVLSTDELLPVWVYLLIKTPIGNWMAQLQYLRQFRFSAQVQPTDALNDESSFLIVTLEASLLFLNSGKVRSGLSDVERDVGTPYQHYIGEFWLRCLFQINDEDESLLSQMFSSIRQGNLQKLESLVNEYEEERELKASNVQLKSDVALGSLCHPLCECTNCSALMSQDKPEQLPSVFNLRNEDGGLNLLHVACIYGRPRIVDFLLSSGANFMNPDSQGLLPLHYAASRGHQNALLLLLHAGCPMNPIDQSRNTPLHLSSLNGHESCVKALVYYAEHSKIPIDISPRNCNGDTPLHFACRYGYHSIVKILVESGALISIKNTRQRSPLDVAHDIHVTRILQSSLNRRTLVKGYVDDFVNVDMFRKAETEGYLMLISDPKPCSVQPLPKLEESDNKSSRRSSIASLPSVSSSGTLTRRTSSVITPSFSASGIESENGDFLTKKNFDPASSSNSSTTNGLELSYEDIPESCPSRIMDDECMVFHISNTVLVDSIPDETEHLRTVSANSLEAGLSEVNFLGEQKKLGYKEREIEKLFTAIEIGDLPLALFHLGIPNEELELDEKEPHDDCPVELKDCHPLCPCEKCVAKSAGVPWKLGLDLNLQNKYGFTPLHVAIMQNNQQLVKILLKYGADVNFRASNGKTALELAKERFHEEIAVILSAHKDTL